jgi:hypothetical protein
MKVTRAFASLLLLAAAAGTASAVPSVRISWDACSPIVVNKQIAPAEGSVNLYVSASGVDQPHKAYQVELSLGSGNYGPLADAWRFDAAGCQGSSGLTMNHITSSKTCPSFQGTAQSLQIKNYSYDPASGKARLTLANSYPAGVTAVNPATRYLLAHIVFDMTYAVNGPSDPGNTCGNLERPVCIAILPSTSWLDMGGVERPFAHENEYVTSNAPNNEVGCPGAVPAKPATWGAIKGQYR